jgi:type IV secretion system protein TrbI
MTGDNSTVKVDPEPELRRTQIEPRGVLQKNLKMLVYLGGAILVIVAAIFSSTGTKTQATKGQPPQPMVQDNTDNNVQDLKNQLQAEQQKGQPHATVPNPDYAPGGRYFGCVPGQVCTPEMLQQNPQA